MSKTSLLLSSTAILSIESFEVTRNNYNFNKSTYRFLSILVPKVKFFMREDTLTLYYTIRYILLYLLIFATYIRAIDLASL